MPEHDPQDLFVLAFKDQLSAQEALTAVARLGSENKLLLRDAVFITKGEDGKARVVETMDPSPGRAALGGAFWGLLFGTLFLIPFAGLAIGAGTAALVAKLSDSGVTDQFIADVKKSVDAGSVNLVLLLSHVDRDALLAEAKRFEGMFTVVYSSVNGETIHALETEASA